MIDDPADSLEAHQAFQERHRRQAEITRSWLEAVGASEVERLFSYAYARFNDVVNDAPRDPRFIILSFSSGQPVRISVVSEETVVDIDPPDDIPATDFVIPPGEPLVVTHTPGIVIIG